MEIHFDGKVALITGGARGIGFAIAQVLAQSRAAVVLTDIDVEAGQAAAAQLEQAGAQCVFVELNTVDPDSCGNAVRQAVQHFGRLDIQVNNAGISRPMDSLEMPADLWNRIIGINLSGVFFSSQAAARQMIAQGNGGSIISLSSMAGLVGFPMRAPYCAAKAGVVALTQTLACEWAPHNIRVNAVAPGYVMTDLVRTNVASGAVDLDVVNKRTPLGRVADPVEIANVVAMLASDQASYVTGETVSIDGGWVQYGGW